MLDGPAVVHRLPAEGARMQAGSFLQPFLAATLVAGHTQRQTNHGV